MSTETAGGRVMEEEMDETMKDAKAGRLGVDAQVLAAEVESLHATLAAVRAWCEDSQVWAVDGTYMGGYQAARRDVLRRIDQNEETP